MVAILDDRYAGLMSELLVDAVEPQNAAPLDFA